MTDVVVLVTVFFTTSLSSPDEVERAEAITMGLAEAPAVVMGSQTPSAGWRTLPRGSVHSLPAEYGKSTEVKVSRILVPVSSETLTGSDVSPTSCSLLVHPARTPTVAAAVAATTPVLKNERREIPAGPCKPARPLLRCPNTNAPRLAPPPGPGAMRGSAGRHRRYDEARTCFPQGRWQLGRQVAP